MTKSETKARSLAKTILWRIIATVNSYAVLATLTDSSSGNFAKAIFMNITGFFVYYGFERLCNSISWGIIIEDNS
jgi:hypothetical protein